MFFPQKLPAVIKNQMNEKSERIMEKKGKKNQSLVDEQHSRDEYESIGLVSCSRVTGIAFVADCVVSGDWKLALPYVRTETENFRYCSFFLSPCLSFPGILFFC